MGAGGMDRAGNDLRFPEEKTGGHMEISLIEGWL